MSKVTPGPARVNLLRNVLSCLSWELYRFTLAPPACLTYAPPLTGLGGVGVGGVGRGSPRFNGFISSWLSRTGFVLLPSLGTDICET